MSSNDSFESDQTGFPQSFTPEMAATLKTMGINELFPVQDRVFPNVVAAFDSRTRFDVCICSPTGSGKTLAYVLPIVKCLQGRSVRRLRALVVTARKELALQAFKVFRKFGSATGLAVQTFTGTEPLSQDTRRCVDAIPDIAIVTPSRLVDLLTGADGAFDLASLQFLVLDEADLLLSDTTQDWLRVVLKSHDAAVSGSRTPAPLHRILCSATLTQNMAKLNQVKLQNPKQLMLSADGAEVTDVKLYAVPATLEEQVVLCEEGQKITTLKKLLIEEPGTVLIFTKSKDAAHRLTRLLQIMGAKAEEFSGQLTIVQRSHVVQNLREGVSSCAVCSDALARGLDLDKVSLVINYEIPQYIQTYIHRVGRTARAGRSGKAVTLVEGAEEEAEFAALRKKATSTKEVAKIVHPAVPENSSIALAEYLTMLDSVLKKELAGHLSHTSPLPVDLVVDKLLVRKNAKTELGALLKRRRIDKKEDIEEASDDESTES
ncbi:hypothetical protein DIPPA_65532 [Diplonema papillatum]|nr:hypothetical protein DIPPA_65532 [Diplonema papillatum]